MGVGGVAFGRDADLSQTLPSRVQSSLAANSLVCGDRLGDLPVYRDHRVQGAHGALGDQRQVPAPPRRSQTREFFGG